MKNVSSWLKYLEVQEYAPNTLELYGGTVKEFLSFVGVPSVDVTADMVENWMLHHSNWSNITRRWHYIAVRKFYKYLLDKHLISEDPTTILPNIRPSRHIDESEERGKEDRVYEPEELIGLIEFKDVGQKAFLPRDRAIIALMAATGMRASEVAWLTVGQIRKRNGNTIFALRKGQNVRKIVVAEFAFPYIEKYLESRPDAKDDDPLFITRANKGINRHTIYELLRTRQKALNLRTGTHNIRYTVLNSVERNADPVVARDIAGQKSLNVTNNYMVSKPEERASAISALPWASRL